MGLSVGEIGEKQVEIGKIFVFQTWIGYWQEVEHHDCCLGRKILKTITLLAADPVLAEAVVLAGYQRAGPPPSSRPQLGIRPPLRRHAPSYTRKYTRKYPIPLAGIYGYNFGYATRSI